MSTPPAAPTDFALKAESRQKIKDLLVAYPTRGSVLMPALWVIQDELGHIPPVAVDWLVTELGVSAARVWELISFYTMFRSEPQAEYVLQVCHNLSCHLMGARSIIAHLEKRLGIRLGETTPDGKFSLEGVECLGACGHGPVLQLGKHLYERLTPEGIDTLLDSFKKGVIPAADTECAERPPVGVAGERILTARFEVPESHTLGVYEGAGGYSALRKALKGQSRDEVRETVKEAGVRGRGGAGFPAGVKWGFVPQDATDVYFFVNADESEPGTFKDRYLLDYDPHLVLEGAIISCYAVAARLCFIYIRGEFGWLIDRVQQAVDEAYAAGYLGRNILGSGYDLAMIVHKGAGAYICGEETGLINSVEGKKGQPNIKPPFPAVSGFLGKPTIVNNVETVASVPYIMREGAAAYRRHGTEKSAGTKLWSVSGPVKNPGVFEVPLGLPFREFFHDLLGGMVDGEELKAVIVGGSSVPILPAAEIMNVNLDYESLAQAGTMLGSGGMIVIPESADMVELIQVLMHFYWDESCGQCTPCREGTGWLHRIVKRLRRGEGRPEDLSLLEKVCQGMAGLTICPLADAAVMPMQSFLARFRPEFEALIRESAPRRDSSRWPRGEQE